MVRCRKVVLLYCVCCGGYSLVPTIYLICVCAVYVVVILLVYVVIVA